MRSSKNKWIEKVRSLKLPYVPLSPTSTAEEVEPYLEALDWALFNPDENDIYNIALTGEYGSGKSSILKTYMRARKGAGLQFLPISLATFLEEKVTKDDEKREKKEDKNDLLRLIELSILQQIFYHEDDKKIPDSRFRKIKSFGLGELVGLTAGLVLYIISLLSVFFPTVIPKALQFKNVDAMSLAMHWPALLIFIFGTCFVIFRSIRVISSVSIEKLSLQHAEINIDKKISKSILNHHLDEILYFFEVTEYNVVIIEDLDRFKETDIFTKLREINLLINSSEKITKKVVFIYAVRDNIFREDNERTKFFDFIIPVISVINPSNSGQKLLDKRDRHKYDLSEDLIDSVSIFITDMRVLHNIANEFYLYSLKLNSSLKHDKLLSLIIYKNLFPQDFAELNKNKGKLYKILREDKNDFLNKEVEKVRTKIQKHRERIDDLENINKQTIQELRYGYVVGYVDSLPDFQSFVVNGVRVKLSEMTSDENFDLLIQKKVKYSYHQSSNYYAAEQNVQIDFPKIEKVVMPEKPYSKRETDLKELSVNKINLLKIDIGKMEGQISNMRKLTIRELAAKGSVSITLENQEQQNLVNLLVREGYIDEEYLDYISLFYAGSLSKTDYQFVLNVKSPIETPYDYPLNRIENIIKKINPKQFDDIYVLNYQLVDAIISDKKYSIIGASVLSLLSDESVTSVSFINGYINASKHTGTFIRSIVKQWNGIWDFIESKSQYPDERKKVYFSLLLEYCDLSDIKALYEKKTFKNALLSYPDFLSIISDHDRMKAIIKLLNLKFTVLDSRSSPNVLINFIYENNYYQINIAMLSMLLEFKGEYHKLDFNRRNYFAIKNSKCQNLIDYINDNLYDYVENVFIPLVENDSDAEAEILELINSGELAAEQIEAIIDSMDAKITDLSKISDVETKLVVLDNNRVVASWSNLFDYYQADGSISILPLIPFIEIEANVLELSKDKIPRDVEGERLYTDFILKLMKENTFKDDVYDKLLQSIPYTFSDLQIEGLSASKMLSLVNRLVLSLSIKNFDSLKEHSSYQVVLLEKRKTGFLNRVTEFALDGDDVTELLLSAVFSSAEKNVIIRALDASLIKASDRALVEVGKCILARNSFDIETNLLEAVLICPKLSVEQRIRIMAWKQSQIGLSFLTNFLNALPDPYPDIAINGKRPMLGKTEYNDLLASILKAKNYISSFDHKEKGIKINTFNP